MNSKSSGRKSSKHPFAGRRDLWFAVEQLIARGDLVICNGVLIWFHHRADALRQDLARLLEEYRTELTELLDPAGRREARTTKRGH